MAVDIFPDIRVPVIGVAFQYAGLSPSEVANRLIGQYERIVTTTVNDIEHTESTSMNGIGIVEDLLPAQCRYPHRHRPGHRRIAAGDPPDAGRHRPAADDQLQRRHRAGTAAVPPPARCCRSSRCWTRRMNLVRPQLDIRARRRGALSVRRAPAPDHDRPGSAGDAGQQSSPPRTCRRAGGAEPDHAGGHGEDRHLPSTR